MPLKAGRVVKEGVNSGNQGGEVNCLARHLEVEAGWLREAAAWPESAGVRWKIELTGGPHLAVTEGEGVVGGLHNVKKETYFGQYATAAQARMGRARARPAREKAGGWLGWEAGRAGWPLGRLGRKRRKILFQIKIGFLNLPRLWKFVERDLGGILA
jgi:hypothetical protein